MATHLARRPPSNTAMPGRVPGANNPRQRRGHALTGIRLGGHVSFLRPKDVASFLPGGVCPRCKPRPMVSYPRYTSLPGGVCPRHCYRVAAALRPDCYRVAIGFPTCTNVDGCERDPDLAYKVNALGSWAVAGAAESVGAALVAVSTDFVFDGAKGSAYTEFDTPNPLSHYGASKLAGPSSPPQARCFSKHLPQSIPVTVETIAQVLAQYWNAAQ